MLDIFIILILILLNGFFSLSEIALVSSKRSRLHELASKGNLGANNVLKLLEKPEVFLSSTQVGITLIGIVSGAYGGLSFAKYLVPVFDNILLPNVAYTVSLIIIITLITYLSIIFGELLPKTIALNNPEKIAIKITPFYKKFFIILYPFVKVLSYSTNFFSKIFFIKPNNQNSITEDELKIMLKVAQNEGVLDKEETEMHHNVFNFNDKRAQDLMTHRTDLEWIDITQPLGKIVEFLNISNHNVFPVCKGNIDNIIGSLHNKDFFEHYKNNDDNNFIRDNLSEPIFIPENLSATKLLKLFKDKKEYFGYVVDEYGTFQGIVTLHDIAEGILGDLPTDDEDDDPYIIVRDDKSLLVDGFTTITDLNEKLSVDIIPENNDYNTVAGFIMNQLNAIPFTGEKFVFNNYSFEIVDMDGNKIDKVIVNHILDDDSLNK